MGYILTKMCESDCEESEAVIGLMQRAEVKKGLTGEAGSAKDVVGRGNDC